LNELSDRQRLKIQSLERKLTDVSGSARALETVKLSSSSEITSLRSQIVNSESQTRKLRSQKTYLENSNESLREKVDHLRSQSYSDPLSKVNDVERLAQSRAANVRLLTENRRLREELDRVNRADDYETVHRENQSLIEEISEAERQLSASRGRTHELAGQLQSLVKLKRQIDRLTSENEKLTDDLTALKDTAVSLVLADKSQSCARSTDASTDPGDSPKKWIESISGVVEENRELQRKLGSPGEVSLDDLRQENEALRAEVEKQRKSNEELRQSLSPKRGGSSDEDVGALSGSDHSGIAKETNVTEEEEQLD
jgi:DNA repair exonuclease SbcCD ATPase subunit